MKNKFDKEEIIDFLRRSFGGGIEWAIEENMFGESSSLSTKASETFGDDTTISLKELRRGLLGMNYRLTLMGGNGSRTSVLMKRYTVSEDSYFDRMDRQLGRYGAFWLKRYYEANRRRA